MKRRRARRNRKPSYRTDPMSSATTSLRKKATSRKASLKINSSEENFFTSSKADNTRQVRSKRTVSVKCPLCLDDFPSTEIEHHASMCYELNEIMSEPKRIYNDPSRAKVSVPHNSNENDQKIAAVSKSKRDSRNLKMPEKLAPRDEKDAVSKRKKIPERSSKRKSAEKIQDPSKLRTQEMTKKELKFTTEQVEDQQHKILTRTLTDDEKVIAQNLDIKIQKQFPSLISSKKQSADVMIPIPTSTKSFASVDDAEKFLVMLQKFPAKNLERVQVEYNTHDSLPMTFLALVKSTQEQEITTIELMKNFLFLVMESCDYEVYLFKKEILAVIQEFEKFLPQSYSLQLPFKLLLYEMVRKYEVRLNVRGYNSLYPLIIETFAEKDIFSISQIK